MVITLNNVLDLFNSTEEAVDTLSTIIVNFMMDRKVAYENVHASTGKTALVIARMLPKPITIQTDGDEWICSAAGIKIEETGQVLSYSARGETLESALLVCFYWYALKGFPAGTWTN